MASLNTATCTARAAANTSTDPIYILTNLAFVSARGRVVTITFFYALTLYTNLSVRALSWYAFAKYTNSARAAIVARTIRGFLATSRSGVIYIAGAAHTLLAYTALIITFAITAVYALLTISCLWVAHAVTAGVNRYALVVDTTNAFAKFGFAITLGGTLTAPPTT